MPRNEQIKSLSFNDAALVDNVHLYLSLTGNTAQSQLNGQGFFVNRFKKPRPENAMHFDRGTDNLLGKFVMVFHSQRPRVCSVANLLASSGSFSATEHPEVREKLA